MVKIANEADAGAATPRKPEKPKPETLYTLPMLPRDASARQAWERAACAAVDRWAPSTRHSIRIAIRAGTDSNAMPISLDAISRAVLPVLAKAGAVNSDLVAAITIKWDRLVPPDSIDVEIWRSQAPLARMSAEGRVKVAAFNGSRLSAAWRGLQTERSPS